MKTAEERRNEGFMRRVSWVAPQDVDLIERAINKELRKTQPGNLVYVRLLDIRGDLDALRELYQSKGFITMLVDKGPWWKVEATHLGVIW